MIRAFLFPFNTNVLILYYLNKPLSQLYQAEYNTELEQIFNLIEGLLKYNPKDRLTCSQALRHPFFDEYILNRRSSSFASEKHDFPWITIVLKFYQLFKYD